MYKLRYWDDVVGSRGTSTSTHERMFSTETELLEWVHNKMDPAILSAGTWKYGPCCGGCGEGCSL